MGTYELIYHPVLEKPWLWEITRVEWHSASDVRPASLDIDFLRDGIARTLRFCGPQNLYIGLDGRVPQPCGEMVIQDISSWQLEGLGVKVGDAGASGSPLQFFARSVEDITSTQVTPPN